MNGKSRLSVLILTTLLIAIHLGMTVHACGDKFLVPSRGSGSHTPVFAPKHAALLIFGSSSQYGKDFAKTSVNEVLTDAGLRPVVVTTRAEFDKLLRGSKWDAVLVDLADAPALSTQLAGTPNAPVVVPMTVDAPDSRVKEARKVYPVVLRFPSRSAAFLSALDRAFEKRTRLAKPV